MSKKGKIIVAIALGIFALLGLVVVLFFPQVIGLGGPKDIRAIIRQAILNDPARMEHERQRAAEDGNTLDVQVEGAIDWEINNNTALYQQAKAQL